MPDAKAVAAMMKYNESLQKTGVLRGARWPPPSVDGDRWARVSFSETSTGGKPKLTDGPFNEAKEVIGAYWMIHVKSKQEAIEWASPCPASDPSFGPTLTKSNNTNHFVHLYTYMLVLTKCSTWNTCANRRNVPRGTYLFSRPAGRASACTDGLKMV